MMVPTSRSTLLAGSLAAALVASPGTALPQVAQAGGGSCSPLVEEAWQAVTDTYYDVGFNGVDWEAARPRGDSCLPGEPHDQVRALLAVLGVPAVRLVPGPGVAPFLAEMLGQPRVGVGLRELLSLDVDERTRLLTVVTPVPDGPAARAGIRTGDVLEAVGGVRTDTMDLARAMALLRGEEGTSVEVVVRRGDRLERLSLRRARLEPPAKAVTRLRPGAGGTVAYIRVADFSGGTGAALDSVVREVGSAGTLGIVLDLRDNPGGLVQELTAAAELFLARGAPIASLRSRPGADTVFLASDEAVTDLPVVVLVNRGTASAAEALAGALQASGRAVLVGERTFGKGLAHFPTELSDGSMVLAPMGRLQSPHGRDILDEGIEPDVRVSAPPVLTLVPELDRDTTFRAAERLLETSGRGPGGGGGLPTEDARGADP